MKNIVAICGKSATGKDSLVKDILKKYPKEFHKIISYTTRPMRDNEIDGVDYFFTTREHIIDLISSGDMFEVVNFNDWVYGSCRHSLSDSKINIGVYNLEGIECLINEKNFNILIFYIETEPKERLLRSLLRENNPDVNEIIRRYNADEKDFMDIGGFQDSIGGIEFLSLQNNTLEDYKNVLKNIVIYSMKYFEKN